VTLASSATNALADTSNFRKHTHGNPIQKKLIDRFHHEIMRQVAGLAPQSFLDAGCGEGFVADILTRQLPGLALTGFDFNPACISVAQQVVPRATFVTASIYEIPFPDNHFDVVGCFEVLEHQTDPLAALRELNRVSRSGLVLSVPHEPFFCLSNMARGKNLDVHPKGSDPDHKQFWTRSRFGQFVSLVADVEELSGSFPWTICVARKRATA
jgi:ubiquinone/menaquinone biosynthesis C-methylase UbiE